MEPLYFHVPYHRQVFSRDPFHRQNLLGIIALGRDDASKFAFIRILLIL